MYYMFTCNDSLKNWVFETLQLCLCFVNGCNFAKGNNWYFYWLCTSSSCVILVLMTRVLQWPLFELVSLLRNMSWKAPYSLHYCSLLGWGLHIASTHVSMGSCLPLHLLLSLETGKPGLSYLRGLCWPLVP